MAVIFGLPFGGWKDFIMLPTEDPKVIELIFQKMFDRIFADEKLKENLSGINQVVMIKYERPDVFMYLHLSDGGSKIIFERDGLQEPDVTLEMKWETAHKLWSGNLDILMALVSQRIRVSGQVDKLLGIRCVLSPAMEIYKEVVASVC